MNFLPTSLTQRKPPNGKPPEILSALEYAAVKEESKSKSTITSKTILITPALAQKWLDESNLNNRRLRRGSINKYARDMVANNWQLNGQAIIFDKDGLLLQGQHRLHACIQANTSFWSVVIFGVEPEAAVTMDVHGCWRPSDHLDKLGTANSTLAASISRAILLFRQGGVRGLHGYNSGGPSHTEIVNGVTTTLPRLQDTVRVVQRLATKKLCIPRIAGMCHYLFAARNRALADKFFEEFIGGANLQSHNPAFVLRENLSRRGRSSTSTEAVFQTVLFIKAWNAYRRGAKVRVLRFIQGEAYPEVEG